MTGRSEQGRDPLQGLRAQIFRHTSFRGMDALVAIIPKGQEVPAEVKRTEDEAGEGRWFPFEGGWKVVCPYFDQSFDPNLFHVEEGGWNHVHCDGCGGTIDAGASCWVAEAEDDFFVICDNCYNRLKSESR